MKTEATTPSFSGYMDDEFYEDTGELQLPRAARDITLARIPEWLYEKLSNWDDLANGHDDDQIQLGEILAFPDMKGNISYSETQPMRLIFNEQWHQKAKLPTAFELELQSTKKVGKESDVLQNTYIFTEKDLPGFKSNGVGQNKLSAGSSFGGVQDPKARIAKRTKYRKAIPKQTSLVGSVARQYLAKPLSTREYVAFSAERTKQAIQGANSKTNIIDTVNEFSEMDKTQSKFNSFIKPANTRKPQTNKAARIPKNELIDLLHQLFDGYAYWPMKALKNRTNQPEAYLKEVLQDIAVLVRSGHYASCWTRQAQYNTNAIQMKDGMPPDVDDIDSAEDEEEMEDVV